MYQANKLERIQYTCTICKIGITGKTEYNKHMKKNHSLKKEGEINDPILISNSTNVITISSSSETSTSTNKSFQQQKQLPPLVKPLIPISSGEGSSSTNRLLKQRQPPSPHQQQQSIGKPLISIPSNISISSSPKSSSAKLSNSGKRPLEIDQIFSALPPSVKQKTTTTSENHHSRQSSPRLPPPHPSVPLSKTQPEQKQKLQQQQRQTSPSPPPSTSPNNNNDNNRSLHNAPSFGILSSNYHHPIVQSHYMNENFPPSVRQHTNANQINCFSIHDPQRDNLESFSEKITMANFHYRPSKKRTNLVPLSSETIKNVRKLLHSVYKSIHLDPDSNIITNEQHSALKALLRKLDKQLQNTLVGPGLQSFAFDYEIIVSKLEKIKTHINKQLMDDMETQLNFYYDALKGEEAKLQLEAFNTYCELNNIQLLDEDNEDGNDFEEINQKISDLVKVNNSNSNNNNNNSDNDSTALNTAPFLTKYLNNDNQSRTSYCEHLYKYPSSYFFS
ncbi:unnamed protein product [Cunninghamella echinulata]